MKRKSTTGERILAAKIFNSAVQLERRRTRRGHFIMWVAVFVVTVFAMWLESLGLTRG